ncbi:MAG TPA: fibronectin type III domain-containing protein [Candidatus Polarisedimenticolia bacterium]|jgi:chitodextrinase|nr:fibronectin type III domain-containing protein [Candidatus Polarisedimenticolia bacterium]
MIGRVKPSPSLRSRSVAIAAALLLAASVAGAAAASADRKAPPGGSGDTKAPTTPGNLTVTDRTAYSVSFAWGAATDNSGSFVYRIVNRTWGTSIDVPSTRTTFTWTASNFQPQQTYTFNLYAVDAANNWSQPSNPVTTTLLADTTTPGAPVVTLTDAGPTHLSVAWTAQDDDPTLSSFLFMNGVVVNSASPTASFTIALLPPQTTYSFTVQVKDSGGHWSPMSGPLSAVTTAADPNDHTAPTVPAGLWGGVVENCEVMLFWSASSDDVTPAQFIRYDISVNGQSIDSTSLGYTHVDEYGITDGPNRFEIVALDEAGNRSAAASATFDLTACVAP